MPIIRMNVESNENTNYSHDFGLASIIVLFYIYRKREARDFET